MQMLQIGLHFQWANPELWNGLFWIWECLWSSSRAFFPFPFWYVFIPSFLSLSPSHLCQILTFLIFYIALQALISNGELSQSQNLALGCSRNLWSSLKSWNSVVEKKVMAINIWRTVTWELCFHILHSTHKCKVNTYQQLPQNRTVNILHAIIVTRILQI